MKISKLVVISIIVLVVELVIVLYLGAQLPADAKLPVHWNIHNQIDGWGSKSSVILPFWLFNVALFLLMIFSGRLFPVFKQNRGRYEEIIPPFTLVLVSFFALIHIFIVLSGIYPQASQKVQFIFVLIGGLFIALGNLLPKLPRNFIAGIKTPWTFYSDEIWQRTSRVGGYCFVLTGLVMLVLGLLNMKGAWTAWLFAGLLAFLIAVPILYSFLLFLKSKKEE